MNLFSRLRNFRRQCSLRMRIRRHRPQIEANNRLYPQGSCKSVEEIIADFDTLIVERNISNWVDLAKGYSYMGINYKGRRAEEYVWFSEWMHELDKLFATAPEQVAILNNKYKLNRYLAQHGIRCSTGIGLMKAAKGQPVLLREQGREEPMGDVLKRFGAVFCKPQELYQGIGCVLLEDAPAGCLANGTPMSWEQFMSSSVLADGHEMQVESAIRQHPAISAFHAKAVNTLRLTTLRDEKTGRPACFKGMLRMGAGDSYVDNVSQGGACVGVDASGQLMGVGCSPIKGATPDISCHPTSGLPFAGFTIPFFEEAQELVCRAHALFSENLLFLSWDVAITPDGPCIIECNTRGDSNLLQRLHGGWRDFFRQHLQPAVRKVVGGN